MRVERFYRPEDVSQERAYAADFWDLYAPPAPAKGKAAAAEGPWLQWVKPAQVVSKCLVGAVGAPKGESGGCWRRRQREERGGSLLLGVVQRGVGRQDSAPTA